MQKIIKIFSYLFIILVAILLVAAGIYWRQTTIMLRLRKPVADIATTSMPETKRLLPRALALKVYAGKNNMDTTVAFLIDMNLHSGSNRFFVFDLNANKIIYSGLVAHGRCNALPLKGRKYSNVVGGGCTSLGHYKIGNKYTGKFGLAYKLYGLDATNNNAFERFVVLHAHECVPTEDVAPYPICQSDGCPTVSPGFLKILSHIIDNVERPITLEIFDDTITSAN